MAKINKVLIIGIIAAVGIGTAIPLYVVFTQPIPQFNILALDLLYNNWVFDGIGRLVRVPKNPKRIVSLGPSNTEILHNISIDKSKVVGRTIFCDYPPEWSDIAVVSDFSGPDVDAILAVYPDLVIGRNIQGQLDIIPQLTAAGVPIFIMPTEPTVEKIFSNMGLIGFLVNSKQNASLAVNYLEQKLKLITNTINGTGNSTLLPSRASTYYEIWNDPVFFAGGGTFIDDALYKAGGINVGRNFAGSWPSLDYPALEIVPLDPDHITIPDWYDKSNITGRVGWTTVTAVVDNNFTQIDQDLIERPGPRIVDAIYILAKDLCPNIFTWI